MARSRGCRGCNNSFGYLGMSGRTEIALKIGEVDPQRPSLLIKAKRLSWVWRPVICPFGWRCQLRHLFG